MKKNNHKTKLHYKDVVTTFLFLFSFSLYAQQPIAITVQGQINDGTIPIPGATIQIKGESRGTVSDFDGQYALSAQPNDTLVISYIGYASVEEPINNLTTINVTLREDATTLREVVINAGYYATTDRERTGSISRVTAKEIENQPVSNPLATLQGRMAGVDIVQTSGVPGSGFEVRIRGQNSINAGNSPLYIIDGVPFSTEAMTTGFTGAILPGGDFSPLNFINPKDIESIEVLKDADATAIYGSRGANGVVLITTKKGRVGKTIFTVNSNSGVSKITGFTKMMNTEQYLEMRREAFANDGITNYPAFAYDINGTWDPNNHTDWQKTLLGNTARFHNTAIGVSGGNEQTQFTIGGDFREESTVYVGDFSYKRATAHQKINHRSKNEKFHLMFATNYAIENNLLPSMDPVSTVKSIVPNAPQLYEDNGDLNWEDNTWTNPLAALNSVYKSRRNNLLTNATIGYQFSKNLNIKTNLGYTNTQLEETRTFPNTYFNPAFNLTPAMSQISKGTAAMESWIVEPQADWTMQWPNSTLQLTAGATLQERKGTNITLSATGFPNNNLIYNLGAASQLQVQDEGGSVYRYSAIFGRANYSINQKYFFNITGRRDGSSRFGPDKRFANFGAVGAAYVFSEETTVQQAFPWLSFGKLRSSYGTTGNDQIGDYQYRNTFAVGSENYNGIAALNPTRLLNPDFGWESNRKFEIALELGLFQDRIQLAAQHYRNRSDNQLVGLPLPGTTGFSSIQYNLNAVVDNTGWEFEMQTRNVQSNNWRWTTSLNVTLPENKLIDFPDLESSPYANQLVIGKPLTVIKLYELIGVNPETGLFEFRDFNNDGQINASGDRQYPVDTAPTLYGGFQNAVSFKNWVLDVMFQFVKRQGFNEYFFGSPTGVMVNQPASAIDRWQQPGDVASMQRYTSGANTQAVERYNRFTQSTGAVSDASFIRLKNIALTYTIPVPEKSGINCRVFLQGQNLLTFTKFQGDDPEQMVTFLPPLKQLNLGVSLQF